MKKKQLFLLSLLLFISISNHAQNYLGIHNSNYAGVMGTDLQPASFVDGRFLVDVNLGSFNITGYQNAVYFDTKVMPKWWKKSLLPDETSDGGTEYAVAGTNPHNDWIANSDQFYSNGLPGKLGDTVQIMPSYLVRLYDQNSSKGIGAYANVQIDALNFAFHVNPKIAVGFAAKFRSVTNLDDLDPKLAFLSEHSLKYSPLWNATFNEKLLNINHLSWLEYGLLYSMVVKDDNEHFMKFGVKPKLLSGLVSAYMYTNNFSYNLSNDTIAGTMSGDFNYGYSSNLDNTNDATGKSFSERTSKMGLGLDLGFVYEWRPDYEEYKYDMDGETGLWRKDKEKYKIRAGVSVLDIGGMRFQKGQLTRNFSVNAFNFDLNTFQQAEDGFGSFDEIVDSLTTTPGTGWTKNEDDQTYFMHTPTALNMQFDYHIWSWIYVNANAMLNLSSSKKEHRTHVANQFSITPSFDHAWFGLHLPQSYNKFSGFKSGVGMRLGPLTVGVTDFRTLFATGKVRGAEVYAGLRVPVLYTHPSDIDGDHVSDKLDECLVVPGVWEFKGCPDTDRDGIKDLEDDCPETPGIPEFKGCPDTDGDGLKDLDDDCPEEAGKLELKGCPDRDNDGIKDGDDACPDHAGPIENNGCPDTDGDGLFDYIDECPSVAGPKENNGCPWPDTDGDGLLDKDDKCPNIAGPVENDGCPYSDTDNDGVLDKDDKCPNTPGPVSNEGCPEIEKDVQEILQTAFENLEFETGKDIIKEVSIPSLSELAEVLVKKSEWKLQIAGHTDNVGNDQSNLVLSKKRAEAVKNFMISKGIDASRLFVLYFGETMPIADNDTPEGRQKNRRVEMTIIFE